MQVIPSLHPELINKTCSPIYLLKVLYGEVFTTPYYKFQTLLQKREKTLSTLFNLQDHKSQNTIPKSIKIQCSSQLKPQQLNKILLNTQNRIVNASIQNTRTTLARIESELYPLHLELANLCGNHWTTIH